MAELFKDVVPSEIQDGEGFTWSLGRVNERG